ncbi:MAG: TetR/AcrR family transcriptional regulator, partial [Acidimicrobiales bacterium]
TEIANRAGVSRCAQLHHFPTKEKLLAAAVEQLLERRNAEFRKAFANLEPGQAELNGAIDLLWTMFRGPTFVAWVELMVAARTDPELAALMVDVNRRFDEQSEAVFAEIFPPAPSTDPQFQRLALGFAYSLLSGLAFYDLVPYDQEVSSDEIVEALKFITGLFNPPSSEIEKEDP